VFASAPVEARPRTRPPGDMDYLYKAPVTSFFGSNLVRMPRLLQGDSKWKGEAKGCAYTQGSPILAGATVAGRFS